MSNSGGWGNGGFALADETFDGLMEALNIDADADPDRALKAASAIENILGQIRGMEAVFDEGPRHGAIVRECSAVTEPGDRLAQALEDLSVETSSELDLNGFPLRYRLLVMRFLDRLAGAVELTRRSHAGKESRHRKTTIARRHIAYRLCRIFSANHNWDPSQPHTPPFESHLTQWRLDFVETALEAAGASIGPESLRKLLREIPLSTRGV